MPVLVVQRGHCFRKTGATGTTGEQAYATAVADACFRLLHGKAGWSVRPTLADENYYRGDAFVAIHCDGSTSSTARGASVGYRTPEGQAFGQAWKRAYANRGWTGGFRPDNYTSALAGYYGTSNAVAAGTRRAFIAECGFRTNPDDRALLDSAGGPERVALAIGDALGITQPPTPAPLEEDLDMRFVRGDSTTPVPGTNYMYGDIVFKVVWPDTAGALAVRTRVTNPNDAGYKVALATGAGMDPATKKPWVLPQAEVDGILDAAPPPPAQVELDFARFVTEVVTRLSAELTATGVSLSTSELAEIAHLTAIAAADEIDRRARDNNPATGPIS